MISAEHAIDDRTSLRPVTLEDATEIFSLVDTSRMHLRQWLPWVDASKTVDDSKAFLELALRQHKTKESYHYCIRYDDKFAGIVSYRRIDWPNKSTELGYWLGQQYQGIGIMTKCCRWLTEYAFSEMKMHRVEILAADGNVRSRAIPHRLGYANEGTLRDREWVNDRYLNVVVYAILEEDWRRAALE